MNLLKLVYELGYRYFRTPYETIINGELVELVESGHIPPCRAIDLGCGTGQVAVFLAQHGFEVTGVDFASSGIVKARRRAKAAGVRVEFVVDDIIKLQKVKGTFDFLVDHGTLDVFPRKDRHLYVQNVLPLTHPGSWFFVSGWEWLPRWWERIVVSHVALEPGEAHRRFGEYFEVERIAGETSPRYWLPVYYFISRKHKPPGYAVYLMRRKGSE